MLLTLRLKAFMCNKLNNCCYKSASHTHISKCINIRLRAKQQKCPLIEAYMQEDELHISNVLILHTELLGTANFVHILFKS